MITTTAKIIDKGISKEYPLLLKSKSSSIVVFAYESTIKDKTFAGVVIHTSDGNGIGEWSSCWDKAGFDVFNGEITLKQ